MGLLLQQFQVVVKDKKQTDVGGTNIVCIQKLDVYDEALSHWKRNFGRVVILIKDLYPPSFHIYVYYLLQTKQRCVHTTAVSIYEGESLYCPRMLFNLQLLWILCVKDSDPQWEKLERARVSCSLF
jgi:hypothetical protein